MEDGQQTEVMLAFPNDVQQIGDFSIHFDDPVEYPGLRIKQSPLFINYCLLISFLIMTLGLYITFFVQPVLVCVNEEGYTLTGTRQERMKFILKDALRDQKNTGEGNINA